MLSDRPLLSLFKSVLRTAHALLLLRPDALAPFLARLRAPRPFPMPGESFVVRLPPPAEALSAGDEGMTWRFVRPNDADEPLADVRVLPLVRALREGHWLLLDEVNLAAAETLERVAGVLEAGGSVALTEKGEAEVVPRHPNFRVFGAMNPPTDFGKKELPASIRSRMTEVYVPALSDAADLQLVVVQSLRAVMAHPPVAPIVTFYQAALQAAEKELLDGAVAFLVKDLGGLRQREQRHHRRSQKGVARPELRASCSHRSLLRFAPRPLLL